MNTESVVRELTEDESWEVLERLSLGRLAYHLGGEVHIVPINYVTADRDYLMFRTAEGNKLFGLHMDADVAFEVDDVQGDSAESVVVRGCANVVPRSEDIIAEELGLRPWIPTEKYNVVRIRPREITGRHFRVER